ncbi:MAG: hypothetical protein OXO52_22280 [Rhodospirillales bacterium]|nr:hypothetical protein [Rhodospirillales bacterium]MDE0380750.1 hypothetical protein [Rhodospirillales bacterium]
MSAQKPDASITVIVVGERAYVSLDSVDGDSGRFALQSAALVAAQAVDRAVGLHGLEITASPADGDTLE